MLKSRPNFTQIHPETQTDNTEKSQRTSPIRSPQKLRRRGSKLPQLSPEQFMEITHINDSRIQAKMHFIPQSKSPSFDSTIRLDKFGIPILKGSKQHQVSFKQTIDEIIYVENWKIHNIQTEEDETKCPCPCQLI